MTTAVQNQYRRGAAAQIAAFTGAQGEFVVDTTNNRLVVQDGATAGGFPAAKLSETLTIQNYAGGFINKFRNPGMEVAQRGTSGTLAAGAASVYTLDGWMLNCTGANLTWQQISDPQDEGNYNCLRIAGATSNTGFIAKQRIEAAIACQLANLIGGTPATPQPIMVTFFVWNSTGSTVTPKILTAYPASSADNWSSQTTDLAATNLQSIGNGFHILSCIFTPNALIRRGYEIQLQGPAITSNANYFDVVVADVRAAPGAAIGFNLNSSPPAPELRPIAVETAFCERYFKNYASMPLGVNLTSFWPGCGFAPFPTTMRAAPTLLSGSSFTLLSGSGGPGTPSVSAISGQVTVDGFAVANSANNWGGTGAGYFSFTGQFSAEL